MSRRPFDPQDLGAPDGARDPDIEGVAQELQRYRDLTAEPPTPGFADRVMSAVDREPAPRRGLLAWLPALRALQQPLRAAALAAVVVLAVGSALVAGQILHRAQTGESPSPAVTTTLSPVPSAEPTEPASETPEPSESPGTQEPTPSASTKTPEPTERSTATPEPTRTPNPSGSGGDHESETPQPSPSSSGSDG